MGVWSKVPGKTTVTWQDEEGKLHITSYEKFKKAKEEGKVKGVDAVVTSSGEVYDFRDGGLFGSDVVSPDKVEEVVEGGKSGLRIKDVYRIHKKEGYNLVYVAGEQFWKNRERMQKAWERRQRSKTSTVKTASRSYKKQVSPADLVRIGNEAIKAGKQYRQEMIQKGKEVVERWNPQKKFALSTYSILYDERPVTNIGTAVDALTGKISREEYYYRLGEIATRAEERANEVRQGGIIKAAEHVYTRPNIAGAISTGIAVGGTAGLAVRGLGAISPALAKATGLGIGLVGTAEAGLAISTAVKEGDRDTAAIITAGLIGSIIGVSSAFPETVARPRRTSAVRSQDIRIDDVVEAMENFKIERPRNEFVKLVNEGAIEKSPIPDSLRVRTDKLARLKSKSVDELLRLRDRLLNLTNKGSKRAASELEVVDKVLNEKILNSLPKEKTSRAPRGVKYDEWVDRQLSRGSEYYTNPVVRTVEVEAEALKPRGIKTPRDYVRSPRDTISESRLPRINVYERGWDFLESSWKVNTTPRPPIFTPVPLPLQGTRLKEGQIEIPKEITGTQVKELQVESQRISEAELPLYDTQTLTIPITKTIENTTPEEPTSRVIEFTPPPPPLPEPPKEDIIPIIPLPTIPALGGGGGRRGKRYRTKYSERFNPIGTWEVLENMNLDIFEGLFGGGRRKKRKGRRRKR